MGKRARTSELTSSRAASFSILIPHQTWRPVRRLLGFIAVPAHKPHVFLFSSTRPLPVAAPSLQPISMGTDRATKPHTTPSTFPFGSLVRSLFTLSLDLTHTRPGGGAVPMKRVLAAGTAAAMDHMKRHDTTRCEKWGGTAMFINRWW